MTQYSRADTPETLQGGMIGKITAGKITWSAILRMVNLVVSVVISFFLMPFLIHRLGDAMYGVWSLVSQFTGYYGLMDMGLSAAVTRYMSEASAKRDQKAQNIIFSTSLTLFGLIAVLILLVSVGVGLFCESFFASELDANLALLILILGVNTALNFVYRAFVGVLTANVAYSSLSLLGLLSRLLRTALIVVLLVLEHKVIAMSVAVLIGGIPEFVLGALIAKRICPHLSLSLIWFRRSQARELFGYSRYALVAQISDKLRFNIDDFVIASGLGLQMVAHYAVAGQICRYFIEIIVSTLGIFRPIYSRLHADGNERATETIFLLCTRISVHLATFVGFITIVWGRPFITRWMGADYLDAYPSLVVMVAALITALWQQPTTALLYGTSKHQVYALYNTLEGLANLALSLVLVKPYGMLGVALGTAIPMCMIKLFLQPRYLSRATHINFTVYVTTVMKSFLISIVSLLIPFGIAVTALAPNYGIMLITAIASFFLYVGGIYFFGFERDEIGLFSRTLQSVA